MSGRRQEVTSWAEQVFTVGWLQPTYGETTYPLSDPENEKLVRKLLVRESHLRTIYVDELSITLFGEKPESLEAAIRIAMTLAGRSLDDTEADRKLADGRWSNRQDQRQDNRRYGGWGYGRD